MATPTTTHGGTTLGSVPEGQPTTPPPTIIHRPTKARSVQIIVAQEEDSDNEEQEVIEPSMHMEDIIPGPPESAVHNNKDQTTSSNNMHNNNNMDLSGSLNDTGRYVKGHGVLASLKDLNIPAEEFAQGCVLLQQAAMGHLDQVQRLVQENPKRVHFRDYDRRTALHVAASEGHLDICQYLVQQGAPVNRSDRWGGSPLDDAHRHRQEGVIRYLRSCGAKTGSSNLHSNLITAAADGDASEVALLLLMGSKAKLNEGDYDKRTALHLASGEGHASVVALLIEAGANVNAEDRWGNRPLDDAMDSKDEECIQLLQKAGATQGMRKSSYLDSSSVRREVANLTVDYAELEMVERIGSGAFGEIYKCRWRGTLVAAKIIKTAKIRAEWRKQQTMDRIAAGENVDDVLAEADSEKIASTDKKEALEDFRKEVSILKALRHPNIVLLLAFSTTEDNEILISELMKCSLLDVFKAHIVHGTKLKIKDAITYATHLCQGMLYLHTCKPVVIHRDLKPANLLIDHSGVLKVADFGLSKVRADPKQTETQKFTMTGETGSYRFMAPEVFRHQNYTETVDIYSFAMILFYLLDGRPPWPYLQGLSAVKKASEEGDRPPIPRNWDIRLQKLLQECWDENAQNRPSFDKILRRLNQFSHDVLKTDADKRPSLVDPQAESGCNCSIM